MAKSKKKEEEVEVAKTATTKFSYPIYQLVIEANNKAEADEKLAKLLAKSD